MSNSYTYTENTTFTVTHAKRLAAKVATDLKRLQRFYGSPSDSQIESYESEVVKFLRAGLLETVTYGYKRDDMWIEPTLKYTARDLANSNANDDDPGRIRPGADITGASFYSFLTYNKVNWSALSASQKQEFENSLPIKRGGATEPGVNGYYATDLTYSSGGKALDRAIVRSFQ